MELHYGGSPEVQSKGPQGCSDGLLVFNFEGFESSPEDWVSHHGCSAGPSPGSLEKELVSHLRWCSSCNFASAVQVGICSRIMVVGAVLPLVEITTSGDLPSQIESDWDAELDEPEVSLTGE